MQRDHRFLVAHRPPPRRAVRFRAVLLATGLVLLPGGSGAEVLRCGMAEGYPPFQAVEQGQPAGFDVAVLRRVAQLAGVTLQLESGGWDDVVAHGRLGHYDCIAGMEITAARQRWFLFTTPYYRRQINVFVRADNQHTRSLNDLIGGIIAGDRDSALENELIESGIQRRIRVRQVASKALSNRSLRAGKGRRWVMPFP